MEGYPPGKYDHSRITIASLSFFGVKAMHVGINAARAKIWWAQVILLEYLNSLILVNTDLIASPCGLTMHLFCGQSNQGTGSKKEISYSDRSILAQLAWERYSLAKQAKELGVDVMLNVDAGTVCTFSPAVTMSRDMLAFEAGEASRFGMGRERWRQAALKFLQCRSLTKSDGSIFH